jgi:hypothetical protein
MTLRAKPQLNGNSRDDFARAYVAILDAMDAIQKARASVSSDVTHARNYQHLGQDGTNTAIEDRRSVDANLFFARNLLGTIASEIVDAIEA